MEYQIKYLKIQTIYKLNLITNSNKKLNLKKKNLVQLKIKAIIKNYVFKYILS